ncbi:MAG: acetyltransferase [Verrucomicrobia bacterium]|nr:MAG: acetyltransferase [Verrucomicrobiota bacterium]
MNLRLRAGQVIAYAYNYWVGHVPVRSLRHLFLRAWLGGFGKGTGVQLGCRFLNGRKIFLGQRNVVNFGCLLDGREFPIRIGSDVSIGPEAAILTLGHDTQSENFDDRGGEVIIGDHAWICYRAIILPGVTIGQGAVVGAGAVVSRDVPPFKIVAGAPAREIGTRRLDLKYELEYAPFLG